jgi:Fe-S cluster assembly ATP-binding protein
MKKNILEVQNLKVSVDNIQIIKGLSFSVSPGETCVFMGPNGSGKSTLVTSLMGNPLYQVNALSQVILNGQNISGLPTDERVRLGLFLAFQSPISIPGVSVSNILRTSIGNYLHTLGNHKNSYMHNPAFDTWNNSGNLKIVDFMKMLYKYANILNIPEQLLTRSIGDGFSGGEKKKIEMISALMLNPKYAFFDEIDTGLDVDALKTVANGIKQLLHNQTGIIIITHTNRILHYIHPDVVNVLVGGRIVKTGNQDLVSQIEKSGYAKFQ